MEPKSLSKFWTWILRSPPADWLLARLKDLLIGALRQGPVPRHIAFVMDGNRRFARDHRIETIEGHNLGFEALAKILEVCYNAGVEVVTVYAFSIENFKRSRHEVDALMDLAKLKIGQMAQHGDLLDRYGACIRFLGNIELLKPDVRKVIEAAVELTKHNKAAVFNVCAPYTSRDEITTAVRTTVADYTTPLSCKHPQRPFSETSIVRRIQSRRLSILREESSGQDAAPEVQPSGTVAESRPVSPCSSSTTLAPGSPTLSADSGPWRDEPSYPDPEKITADTLTQRMFTAGLPPLDLLVRTSGVERLSDFMLWQCHEHTSIVFRDCLWPEFDLWQFLPVLVEWQWWQCRSGLGSLAGMIKSD